MTILIVEDDNDINKMLSELLTLNGYKVISAYSGTEALLILEKNNFNLIILDLMLPGLSGEELIKRIRNNNTIPVICVSAKDDKISKINLLKLGADDYITKPFDNDELLARIEAQIRRSNEFSSSNLENILQYKDLCMNLETLTVFVNAKQISLTKREFLILELLLKYPKKVFTRSNIYEHVWNNEFFGDDNTVNVHISNIRAKLQDINPKNEYIQTVWGIGFKMAD